MPPDRAPRGRRSHDLRRRGRSRNAARERRNAAALLSRRLRPALALMFTPDRRRGVEILDDPAVDPDVRNRSIDDVTRSNRILGGLRAALLALKPLVRD